MKEHTKQNFKYLSWDEYFFLTCKQISLKSPCLSRRIGAILVRDKSIIATGYNGPPRGIPHCGEPRFIKDNLIPQYIRDAPPAEINNTCPRRLIPEYKSGEMLDLCPAQHAEINCISNAARIGANTIGATLYSSGPRPCKICIGTIINAGVIEIVLHNDKQYDKYSEFIYNNSNIKIREFKI